MQFIYGMPLRHAQYGDGVLEDYFGDIITVRFADGRKSFWVKEAFEKGILTAQNEEDNERIAGLIKAYETTDAADNIPVKKAFYAIAEEAIARRREELSPEACAQRTSALKEELAPVLPPERTEAALARFTEALAGKEPTAMNLPLADEIDRYTQELRAKKAAAQPAAQTATAGTVAAPKTEGGVLRLVAKIFMLLGCISYGAALIPLFWTIPMTVHYWRCVKEGKPVGTAFKICSLLFVNLIAGILMFFE